jgi:membrane protease YdiL (CAAX protease family)
MTESNPEQAAAAMRPLRFGSVGWRDPLLWLAISLGPMAWSVLLFVLVPSGDWDWPLSRPMVFLLPVVVYPVLEEIVFRGLVQDGIARFTRSRWGILTVANLAASVVFAASHLLHQSPLWATLVFFPSLIFGWFRERHDTLGTPILLHVWYNLGVVWLFWG